MKLDKVRKLRQSVRERARLLQQGLLVVLVLCSLVAMTPPANAENVVGFFEGQSGGLNSGGGVITLTGWVLADSGIKKVVIQVDGVDLGSARYGQSRPDVAALYPGFPNSNNAGFGYKLNSTDFLNGNHLISAKVTTQAGTTVVLSGSRTLFFNNNTHNLVPFGAIDHPQRNAHLFGTCDESAPSALPVGRRYAIVEGWALDLGVEIGDTGVSWVELLIDGSIVANTRTTCRFDRESGGLTDCYGLPRPDIEFLYPFALDAPNSGFRFALDIGALIEFGYVRGYHVLTIRAGDITSQHANIAEIPVDFFCSGDLGNEGSFGRIESPRRGRAYSGNILFQGWALDGEGVQAISLRIDGQFIGQAAYGVASRPAVAARYPGYPDIAAPAWRFTYDSTEIADGFHQAQVVVIDVENKHTVIAEVDFFVDNVRD